MPDITGPAAELADAIVSAVKDQAYEFLKQHEDARTFLVERAKRFAKLTVDYTRAQGPERDALLVDLRIVRQTLDNDMTAIALDAAVEARKTWKGLMRTAFDVIVKALPALV